MRFVIKRTTAIVYEVIAETREEVLSKLEDVDNREQYTVWSNSSKLEIINAFTK